mgnify:CR=1 FL=1
MKISTQLRLGAGSLAVSLALASAPAFAQEDAAAPAEAENEDQIIVTGSRISNPNLELSSPVAVVNSEDIDLRQQGNIENVLREIPGVVPSTGSNLNNGNGGSTFINLRGIGSNRNITLLNSTRLVPVDRTGRVNLDVIPVALIERVDVLTGGAGSTYGADAISGVINFITKQDFEGMDFTVNNSITEQGDASNFRADLTLGANFDDGRGNAVISVGYSKRDPLRQGQRDFSVDNISARSGNAGGSSTTAPTRISGGSFTGFQQIDPASGDINPGFTPFNYNPFNYFQLPQEQFRIYAQGNYEITEGIEVFSEAMYVDSQTDTNAAPSGSFGFGGPVPLSNPFLQDNTRNQLCGAAGISQTACDAAATVTDPTDPNYQEFTQFTFARRFVEFGERLSERTTRLFQIKVGARGSITDNLNFEVFGAHGENEVIRKQSGNGLKSRLIQAMSAVDENTCVDPSNGCVPFNLFGEIGSITPEMQAFLDTGNQQVRSSELSQLGGYIDGDLALSSPWSDQGVNFVLGVEYRDYTAGNTADLLSQTPGEVLGNGAAVPDLVGVGYDVKEAFAELVVPIVEGKPGFEELTLQLGGRMSDYSTTGTEYTWKVGGTYSPISAVQIRGNYQRVTRAPNVGELFAPQTTGLGNFSADPCQGAIGGDADLVAVCLAQGAPASSIGNIIPDPAAQGNVTTGGNPNLGAEDATTWTIGAVIRPDAIPGLSMTVDYYNIKVTGAITNPTEDDLFRACFDSVTSASASDPACTSIRRNPVTGNLFGDVSTTFGLPQVLSNLGEIKTDGVDLAINYRKDFDFATWTSSFNGNWTNSSTFNANPANPVSLTRECVGFYSSNCASIQPKLSSSWRNTLTFDNMSVSLFHRWIDGVEVEPLVASSFLEQFQKASAQHYFDLTLSVDPTENLKFIFGAQNVLDNKPPFTGSSIGATGYNSGNTFPSTYDVLGRRYSVTARLRF